MILCLCLPQRTVLDLESVIADKEQHSWEMQSTLEELQVRSRPLQVTEIGVQTELSETRTVAQQEAPTTEATPSPVPTGRQEVPHGHAASGAGEKRRRPDSGGRRPRESPVHRDLVRLRMSSPKPGSVGELESNLENEMRAAGVEITDSFDSSECVGFSDATLDDTLHDAGSAVSLESLKSEKTVPEGERPVEPPSVEKEEKGKELQAKPEQQPQPQGEEAVLGVPQSRENQESELGTGNQNVTASAPPLPPKGQPAALAPPLPPKGQPAAASEVVVTNLEDLGETSSEEVLTSSSESDLPALKKKGESLGTGRGYHTVYPCPTGAVMEYMPG